MGNQPTSLKVLLVEDNPGDARLVREMLHQVGPEPIELRHVERLSQAIRYIRDDGFNAVVLDLSLPDSEGFQTFARAYTQALRAPIVVLTGLDDKEAGIRAVREGAQDYLVKGQISGPTLYNSIRYAIERHRAEIGLHASEARLRAIIDAAPDAVITIDAVGRVSGWSAQAERLLGWPATEIIGRPLAEKLLRARSRATWDLVLARAKPNGERTPTQHATAITALHRDGRDVALEFRLATIELPSDSFYSIYAHPAGERSIDTSSPLKKLTPRQRDVLQLIADGHSTRESARRLGVSVKTIEAHRAQLMKRLGIRSVAGLVRYAARVGLIRLES